MAKLTDKDPLAELKADFGPAIDRLIADVDESEFLKDAAPQEVAKVKAQLEQLKRARGL